MAQSLAEENDVGDDHAPDRGSSSWAIALLTGDRPHRRNITNTHRDEST